MKDVFWFQVHPNPNRPDHLKVKYYEFAGRIVGKCLYESAQCLTRRQNVKARFTRSFLAQLLGLRVHYKVKTSWVYFYQFTSKIHVEFLVLIVKAKK